MKSMKLKNKSLSLFHLYGFSLNNNFDDLQYLLNYTKYVFDIIVVSEIRIKTQVPLMDNLNLNTYSFEIAPT